MFVVFGCKKTIKPFGSLLSTDCHRCHNRSAWGIWRETEWLSLFFIRLLPFKNKHYLTCSICSDAVLLGEKNYNQLLNHQKLSTKDSQKVYDDLIKLIENHQFASMTEGKKQYYRNSQTQA